MDDDRPDYQGPSPEAYGRVTNPERYKVVQEVALSMLDRLEHEYRVRRSEPSLDPDLLARLRAFRSVRLDPDDGEAGPLTCTFTEFPGVVLGLGAGYQQAFPSCGCDACDEEPDRVATELVGTAELFVHGHLVEGVERHTYSFRIGGRSGTTIIADDDARRTLPPSRSWKAWTTL